MKVRIIVAYIAVLLSAAHLTVAEPTQKTIFKRKGREPELIDSALYRRSSNEYRITRGKVTFPVARADVEYCKPPKPEGFDQIGATDALETIVEKYHRRWWDVQAFRKLMPIYLKNGDHDSAIQLYQKMKPIVGSSMPPSLSRDYWRALSKAGQDQALQQELDDTIANGTRDASAWAYLMRGDILAAEGRYKKALVDGYFKTIVLFDDVASCRKDALEKAAVALQELGDYRSEKFRRILQDEFPE